MISDYQQLLKLTQSMLEDCENQQWESLTETEEKRQVLIKQIQQKASTDQVEVIPVIEEIIAINRRILAIAEISKQENSQLLLNLKRSLKQTTQYQENS